MREIKTDFVEKVIGIMKNNQLTEVTLENEKEALYIKTNGFSPVSVIEEEKIKDEVEEIQIKEEQETKSKKIIPVISDMIGVLFLKPSPDERSFVQIGDKVKVGQQICIIETIKLMNKISAEVNGTIKEICIENAKPVEYGQTIMYIEQD